MDAWGPDEIPCISTVTFRVVRETPKGVWIIPSWAGEHWKPRFVLNGDGRRYAHETFEQAKYAYLRRKQAHVQNARHSADCAQRRLELIEGYTFMEHVESQMLRAAPVIPPPML